MCAKVLYCGLAKIMYTVELYSFALICVIVRQKIRFNLFICAINNRILYSRVSVLIRYMYSRLLALPLNIGDIFYALPVIYM